MASLQASITGLLFAFAAPVAGAQQLLIHPTRATQWDTLQFSVQDTLVLCAEDMFRVERIAGTREYRGSYQKSFGGPQGDCVLRGVTVNAWAYPEESHPPGEYVFHYLRPGTSTATATFSFRVEASAVSLADPVEFLPASPTSADVVTIRFYGFIETGCFDWLAINEARETPQGDVEIRIDTPQIIPVCPGPFPAKTFSLAPRNPGSYKVRVVDSRNNAMVYAEKTLTIREAEPGADPPDIQHSAASVSDLWWEPNESGWGVSVIQHGPPPSRLFATLFMYQWNPSYSGIAARPQWHVLPGGEWVRKNVFAGTLYRASGSAADTPFVAQHTNRTKVGHAMLEFASVGRMKLHVNWLGAAPGSPAGISYAGNSLEAELQRQPY